MHELTFHREVVTASTIHATPSFPHNKSIEFQPVGKRYDQSILPAWISAATISLAMQFRVNTVCSTELVVFVYLNG